MIIKKPYPSFNECLFYNEEDSNLNNTDCTSHNIDNEYLLCSCTHLTDFTISDLNPVLLFKDIKQLLKQSRIITSFDAFSYLTNMEKRNCSLYNRSNFVYIYYNGVTYIETRFESV